MSWSADRVEDLKLAYTDKYVTLSAARPELVRFQGQVGRVKTINMNGRALVEFVDYHNNTGWYDVDLQSLTIVDPPAAPAAAVKKVPSRPAEKPAEEKPAAAKPETPPAAS